jgi:hypothetical protein
MAGFSAEIGGITEMVSPISSDGTQQKEGDRDKENPYQDPPAFFGVQIDSRKKGHRLGMLAMYPHASQYYANNYEHNSGCQKNGNNEIRDNPGVWISGAAHKIKPKKKEEQEKRYATYHQADNAHPVHD